MRVLALMTRIIQQFFRDKRTLGLMIVAPMFILWLLSLVFSGNAYTPKIGVDQLPEVFLEQIESHGAEVIDISSSEAESALDAKQIDAFIDMDQEAGIRLFLEGSDSTANRAVMTILQRTLQEIQGVQQTQPTVQYMYGSEEMSIFDEIGPYLIGYFVFFFVFLISGVSFLRERTGGTLERLLVTPIKRWEIVAGYVSGYGVFTLLQTMVIVLFAIHILEISLIGSIWHLFLTTFLLAITALSLGTLLSAYANNELQVIQFIPLVIVPQVFFSGLFNLETMEPWLRKISVVMPLTYGGNAMNEIMIRGSNWNGISTDIYVLLGFSLLFMILNVVALKKHRSL